MPSQEELLLQEINRKEKELKDLKIATQNIKKRSDALSSQPVTNNAGQLRSNLAKFIPPHLMPKNVGHLYNVQWPFHYSMTFNLSQTQPWQDNAPGAVSRNTRQSRFFQVTQESAFLFTAVSRHCDDYNSGGDLGPLQIEIKDRQSTRFFSNAPIPLQMLGQEGYPTVMPTPFLVMPNAVIEAEISSYLDEGVIQNVPDGSSGIIQLTFLGYRMRIENAQAILSSIYG